ncbi:MAG: very short patch repair endonuclease, partial [Bacteroidales bacterium]|nr:very short patch repair endonuclease [Bacteroidales bacterium]
MADKFSKEKRSEIMRTVKHKDTLPELIIQSLIRDMGIAYERESRILNTKPDIVIPEMKKVFFINGCFWHGHICKRGKLPETNRVFWEEKIKKTKERDNEPGAVQEVSSRTALCFTVRQRRGWFCFSWICPVLHRFYAVFCPRIRYICFRLYPRASKPHSVPTFA